MNDLRLPHEPQPCEPWAERLSLAASDCLSPDEEREVRRHIETCRACREHLRRLTELCGVLVESCVPDESPDAAVVSRVMSAIAGDESRQPPDRTSAETAHPTFLTPLQTTWRWIMRSPVSRATAAAVFVFAIVGVALWFHGNGTAPAFADYLQPILEGKSVRYKMTTEMKGPSGATATTDVMWLDPTRSRMQMEVEMPNGRKSGSVQIWDGRQRKSLHLQPAEKRATVYSDADMPDDKKAKPDDPFWFRTLLLGAVDKPGVKRESLGEKEIDGRRAVGFRVSLPDAVFIVWGDPKTGRPVRIETTVAVSPNVKMTLSDFEFDVEMDESLFSVEPPAGYEVMEIESTPSDDSPLEEKDLIEMFRYYGEATGGCFPDALDMMPLSQTVNFEEWCDANQRQPRKTPMERHQEGMEAQRKLRRGVMFAVQLQKEADSHYAGRGVLLGATDTPVFWYRPKDAEKYRVIYADLSVREAGAPPAVPEAEPDRPEKDLIEMLRCYSDSSGGSFPHSLDFESLSQVFIGQSYAQGYSEKPPTPSVRREIAETLAEIQRGLSFINALSKEADSHYAGKGVSRDAPDTPVFWYRPEEAKHYRVIYADLSVREAETPPGVRERLPEQDVIDMFRHYAELSGGAFPDSLELAAMSQIVTKKDQRAFTIRMMLEVFAPGEGRQNEERRRKVEQLACRVIDLQELGPGDEKPDPEEMTRLSEQMLDLVDWEKLAPGKGELSDKQKQKLIDARTQAVAMKMQATLMPKILAAIRQLQPGLTFVDSLPPEADLHYAGKGAKLDTPDRPILWYKPTGAANYRVIYADLGVEEMTPEEAKGLPEAECE